MKIGIIAMGRSGGCQLGKWLGMEYGYPFNHEPYWNGIQIGENSVTKYHIKEWIEARSNPQLDKRIGLWRENLRECAISNIRAEETNKWHNPYVITNEWIKERENQIHYRIQSLMEYQSRLKGIPTIECWITYEGIYNNGKDIQRLLEYLDIKEPKYLHLLDNSLRLRETPNKPKRKQLI